jgi:AcrR family transcriptional regulator
MSGPTRTYTRLSVEQRRTQLLAASIELFGRHRPEEISVDDVAAAAGVSRPLVYRYFPGGRQQLYEAAMRQSADELARCFIEPPEGAPSRRMSNVLDRYFAYVDQHDAAYSALLRGGSVVDTSRTNALVDDVRRAGTEQVLFHLAAPRPGPRLAMMVRSWIASVEAVSLTWLDEGKKPSSGELSSWLADHFTGLLLVTAASDPETATVAAKSLAQESPGSPAGRLARRVAPLAGHTAHLLPPGRAVPDGMLGR